MLRLLPLLLLATVSAQTDTYLQLSGPITTTLLSGENGDRSFFVTSDVPHAFLVGLTFGERSDNPCYIKAQFYATPNGPDSAVFDDVEIIGPLAGVNCDTDSPTPRSLERIRGAFPPGPGVAAVHGIQVCTNDRNENHVKLKGARILVSAINRNGNGQIVRDPGLAEDFERRNCSAWQEPLRRCPTGTVAVGLQVFTRGTETMTGLALQCRAATVTVPPQPNTRRGVDRRGQRTPG